MVFVNYERMLRKLNRTTRNLTSDITHLYKFIDGLIDMSSLLAIQLTVGKRVAY